MYPKRLHYAQARTAELKLLSDWIDTRFKEKFVEDHDLLVMGDFNTPKTTDPIFGALVSHGLKIPKPLVQLKAGDRLIEGSNLGFDARFALKFCNGCRDSATTRSSSVCVPAVGLR